MAISKRKKILFFVSEDWYFLSHRLKIAIFLLKKGYNVHLCCKDTGLVADILKYGIKWHNIELERKSLSLTQFFKESLIFYKLVKKLNPNIIQLISMRPIVVGIFSLMFLKKRNTFLTFTGLGFLFTEKTFKSNFLRILISYFLLIAFRILSLKAIVQNKDDKIFITKKLCLRKKQIIVIKGSGIDLKHFIFRPEPVNKKITIVYAGRILKDKGIKQLIDSFKLAKKEFNNLSLVLAGPLDKNNPSAISEKELNTFLKIKDIHYLGNVKDTKMVWKKSNIAILLSKREGLPLSLMEAAATGRCIISTDVPGCREIAKNGLNAITVTYGNVKETKLAMLKLAKDKELRRRYAEYGRTLLEKEMRQEIIFSKYLSMYENISI